MIDPNDLRRGNWIRFNKSSPMPLKEVKVASIDEKFIGIAGHKSLPIYLEGIPLTEERLIKFGFEISAEHVNWVEVGIKCNTPSKHIVVRCGLQSNYFNLFNHSECDFTQQQFISKVEYAHQLQNLYLDLAKKQLEFNE